MHWPRRARAKLRNLQRIVISVEEPADGLRRQADEFIGIIDLRPMIEREQELGSGRNELTGM